MSRRNLELADGRRLAWAQWGPEGGRPVLFCPGAGTSGSLGFGADLLPGLGARLLAVDRPGLGWSSPHPGKTLDTWVDDVRQLVAHLGTDDLATVGFSQGAPFAVALAGAGLASSVALVAGQDDMPTVRAALAPEVRELVDAVAADPSAVQAHIASVADADWLWTVVADTSGPRDRAFYTDPAFAPAFRQALAEGFRQGPDGYARDLVTALGPWPYRPEDVGVPVDLWYGGLDTSPVHSPDAGRTLAARFPAGRRHLLPDEGSSLLWTRAGEVLAAVLGP